MPKFRNVYLTKSLLWLNVSNEIKINVLMMVCLSESTKLLKGRKDGTYERVLLSFLKHAKVPKCLLN